MSDTLEKSAMTLVFKKKFRYIALYEIMQEFNTFRSSIEYFEITILSFSKSSFVSLSEFVEHVYLTEVKIPFFQIIR